MSAAAASQFATRLFAPVSRDWERSSALVRILAESLAFVGVILTLAHWLNPQDPFGTRAQFPWIWLGPTLLAVRYGTIDGVLATAMLLAAWLLPDPYGMSGRQDSPPFPQEYFLGGLVLVLMAGQFADVWNNRLARIRAANAYLDERLTSLTRAHYLLRLSHQRLEHELLVRPVTLSDMIVELRPLTAANPAGLERADDLLRLLAGSCELESAAVHPLSGEVIGPEAVAEIGESEPLAANDPLVRMALDSGRLVHVNSGDATLYRSRYLVACPLIPSNGAPIGILLVRSIPFFALNDENLQFLAVLCGYYADGLTRAAAVHGISVLRPNAPPDFALELVRMKRLHDEAGVESTLLALGFERSAEGRQAFEHVRRIRRGTDTAWEIDTAQRHLLMLLMPMSGPADVEGLLMRLGDSLRQQFGKDVEEMKIMIKTTGIGSAEPEWILDDMLNRCGVDSDSPVPIVMGETRA